MAIAAVMSNQDENSRSQDDHENDVVMPGFRFHPTEEELVEFYLRRKVEGKRFNVELITFLDLYRYDPWELPALAAIGEKEWYFYVPRDRKYRNGDRPNRVTTSGYWKATGADRMIRSESSRSIGLKKTLVFYSGKAPKGIRTSWIMNEYRLPHHETERLQKAEISLCRVYKRAGVDDHPSLPRSVPTRGSPSQHEKKLDEPISLVPPVDIFRSSYGRSPPRPDGKINDTSPSSSADMGTSLPLSQQHSYTINPLVPIAMSTQDDAAMLHQSKQLAMFSTPSPHANVDDLQKLVNNYSSQQHGASICQGNHLYNPNNDVPNLLSQFNALQTPQLAGPGLSVVPGSVEVAAYSDRLWDWSAVSEASKDYNLYMK